MGTNYYWHDRPCDSCGRYERIHVCKSQRTWRGYLHVPYNPEHPEWGYHPESPFGYPVVSLADWRKVFTTRPGQLVDEYGRVFDPIAFLDEVKPPTKEQQALRREWVYKDIATGDGWLDNGLHWFYAREFS